MPQRGLGAHPCPAMVAAQTRQLSGNGNETLVAMEIPNTSDSDVALLWQLHPKPSGGSAGAIYFSLLAEKGLREPHCAPSSLQCGDEGCLVTLPLTDGFDPSPKGSAALRGKTSPERLATGAP